MESPHSSQQKLASLVQSFPEEDLRQSGADNPGYYPARLGQEFHNEGRYVIVRKLGWGRYSSVWLARDCRRVYAIDSVARVLISHTQQRTLRYVQNSDLRGDTGPS